MAVLLGAVKPAKRKIKYSEDFEEWLQSDNVYKVKPNLYTTHESQWRINYTKPELYKYYKKEYNNY